jgi:hypothetical protein
MASFAEGLVWRLCKPLLALAFGCAVFLLMHRWFEMRLAAQAQGAPPVRRQAPAPPPPSPDVDLAPSPFACRADLRRKLSRARTPAENVRCVLQLESWDAARLGYRPAELIRAARGSFVAVVESDPEEWLPVLWKHHVPVREVGAAIVPALARALASDDERVHPMAVEMLAALGSDAEAARPAVRALLARDDWEVEYSARRALVAMGDDPAEHVDALVAGLRATSSDQRECAARYLGKMGRDAQDAVPALAEALEGESPVTQAAAEAIGLIAARPDAAVPALLALLDSDLSEEPLGSSIKCWAVTALTVFAGRDQRATEFVQEVLDSAGAWPARYARCTVWALERVGAENREPALLIGQALDEGVPLSYTLTVVLSLAPDPPPAFVELASKVALRGGDVSVQRAVQYLGTLARRPESCAEAMSALLAVAGNRGSTGRVAAVGAISPSVACMQGEAAVVLAGILAEDGYALDDEGRYVIVRHALCSLADLGPTASRAEREVRELKARYPGSKAREIDRETGIVSLPELADAALAAMQLGGPVDKVE